MMPDEHLNALAQIIPELNQCKVLGIKVKNMAKGLLLLELPYSDKIIGNPETGVIHGGALTTLLDTACGFCAISSLENAGIAPTLDLRIDYMRAAEPNKPVFAKAEIYRSTRNVLFSRGIAFQADEDKPIAHCTATFMCLDEETLQRSATASSKSN